jgi:uncharacterized membrane protein YhaH (DUF805 family)
MHCRNAHDNVQEAVFCGDCGVDLRHATTGATPLMALGGEAVAATPVAVPETTPHAAEARTERPPPAAAIPAAPALPRQSLPPPVVTGAGTPPERPPFSFDANRLTTVDKVVGGSAVLLLLSLFLPWFGLSEYDYSVGGLSSHSFLALVLLSSVALIAYFAARAGWDDSPVKLPAAHAPLLLVVGGAQLFLVLLAFAVAPEGLSRQSGAWLALIAALGATLPVAVPAVRGTLDMSAAQGPHTSASSGGLDTSPPGRVKHVLRNYANVDGRAGRAEFWWFALFYVVAVIAGALVDAVLGTAFFGVVVLLGLVVPSVCVTVRRLHDSGKSGWMYLLSLIPLAGGIVMLVFCLLDGDPGRNDYGPPPA